MSGETAGDRADGQRLVGRDDAARRLRSLIEASDGPVVVTGPPGVGKSLLAADTVDAIGRDTGRPTAICPLDRVETVPALREALARQLRVDAPDRLEERIALALQGESQAVVLLDDADGLTTESEVRTAFARQIDRWSDQTDATFVVTARRPLQTPHERPMALSPLGTDPAVALFEQAARRVRHDFRVTPDNRDDVERIVDLVDRLPRAIELAASRVRLLGPAQLAERLDGPADRDDVGVFEPLERALQDLWRSLPEWARRSIATLSVFRGGFTVDAAEAVLQPDSDGPAWLDALEFLVDSSLVQTRRPAGASEVRFRILRTTRRFVLRRDEPDRAAERRHADFYARRVEDWWGMRGHTGSSANGDAMSASVRQVDLAFERSLQHRWPAACMLGFGLILHHTDRDQFRAAQQVLERLDETEIEPPSDWERAHIGYARCFLQSSFGDFERALELGKEALRSADRAEATNLAGRLERLLSHAELARSKPDAALDRVDRALDHFEASGGPGDIAGTLTHFGRIYRAIGDDARAETHIRDALERARDAERPDLELRARLHLGLMYADLERFDDALRHLEAASTLNDELPDWRRESMVPSLLGSVYHRAGDDERAKPLFERGIAAKRRDGDLVHLTDTLTDFGMLLLDREEPGEARQAFIEARRHSRGSHCRNGYDLLGGCELGIALSYALEERWEAADRSFEAVESRLEELAGRKGGARGDQSDELLAMTQYARDFVALTRDDGGVPEERRREVAERLSSDEKPDSTNAGHLCCRRLAMRALANHAPPEAGESQSGHAGPVLRVTQDCETATIEDGPSCDLSRRKALRRILVELVEAHRAAARDDERRARTVYELLEAGWPDQKLEPESGKSRVYTAIGRMRDMGLQEIIETVDDGYRLHPAVTVVDE